MHTCILKIIKKYIIHKQEVHVLHRSPKQIEPKQNQFHGKWSHTQNVGTLQYTKVYETNLYLFLHACLTSIPFSEILKDVNKHQVHLTLHPLSTQSNQLRINKCFH